MELISNFQLSVFTSTYCHTGILGNRPLITIIINNVVKNQEKFILLELRSKATGAAID